MIKKMKVIVANLLALTTLFASCAIDAQAISSNQTGTNNGFYYSFWTNGQGSVNMTLGSGGNYSVTWSNVGDFTCGKGWSTGSGHTISYTATYQNSGGGALALYGWTKNPLVEYYICESQSGVASNSGTQRLGTLTSDGGTYTIYKHQQVNQPSIIGNSTFWQYISVRDTPRTSGTITIQNHFDAWKKAGLNLGSHDYQIMLTESWNGSGQSNVTVKEGGTSSTPSNPTNPTNPTSPSGSSASKIEAENYSSASSSTIQKIGTNGGNGVGYIENGNYLVYNNVNFGSGANSLTALVANGNNSSTNIDARLDSASGTLLGTLQVPSTGGWSTYQQKTCNISSVTGTHNLYVKFSGPVNVDWFAFGSSGTTPSNNNNNNNNNQNGSKGNVYLTFDDGPNNSNSATLINTLKSAGCNQATLFVWGNKISSNQTGWNAYKNSGFSIQNHTWSHQHMTSWSYQQVYNDIQQCNQAIQNAGKPKPTKIRLPYLESNSTIQQACSALGLSIVSPSVDTQDWNGASTQSIISACNNLQVGGNPLMHDQYQTTDSALATIVQNLKNRGLGFAQY
ncbi:MAG TPA: glycoside hydrolase family 11 protein [Clostridia bacterium]